MKKLSTVLFVFLLTIFTFSATNAQTINYSLDEGTYYSLEDLKLVETDSRDWSGKYLSIESDIPLGFKIYINGDCFGVYYAHMFSSDVMDGFELPSIEGDLEVYISKNNYWDNSYSEVNITIFILTGEDRPIEQLSDHNVKNGLFEALFTNIPMWKHDLYLFPKQNLNHYSGINLHKIQLDHNLTGMTVSIDIFYPELEDEFLNSVRTDRIEDLFDDFVNDIDYEYSDDMTFTVQKIDVSSNRAVLELSLSADVLKNIREYKSFHLDLYGLEEQYFINSIFNIDVNFRTEKDGQVNSILYSWFYEVYENNGIRGDVDGDGFVTNDDEVVLAEATSWTTPSFLLWNTVYNEQGINIARAAVVFNYYPTNWDVDALHMHLNGGNSFSDLWGFGFPISDGNDSFVKVILPEDSRNGTTFTIENTADFMLLKGRFSDGREYSKEISSKGFVYIELPEGVEIYDVLGKNSTNGVTGVENDAEIPTDFSISQNYPNPFNPSTKIDFALPASIDVTLKVFNSLGQEVAELVSVQMEAGNHSVDFDASSLTSGIYFYRIQAGSFIETRKMTLLK